MGKLPGAGSRPFRLDYTAWPTCAAFHKSDAFVRCILGPVGSGKSSACIIEGPMLRAQRQAADEDGVRRTRGFIIRNTYSELSQSTVKTFRRWYGDAICTYKGDKPLVATVRYPMPDGTRVECEVVFLACDKPEDAAKLRSTEWTWGYINEASEILSQQTVFDIIERLGRYPEKRNRLDERGRRIRDEREPDGWAKTGGPTWYGLWMDSNCPDDEHWIYRQFEVARPAGWEMFKQPPAVFLAAGATPEAPVYEVNEGQRRLTHGVAAAENLAFLDKNYYVNALAGKSYENVRTMYMNEYGTVAYGRPVYPEYQDHRNWAPSRRDPKTGEPLDVELLGGIPLLLGWDFGFQYAACVICQFWRGQLRVLEDVLVSQMGTRQFAEDVIRPKLVNDYRRLPYYSWGDPAGRQRKSTDASFDIDVLCECGIKTQPCVTNSPRARIDSVKYFLTHTSADGEPGLLLGSKAVDIRKGMAGRYYFRRVASGREDLYSAEPKKNEYSHPADALQYVATMLLADPEAAALARQVVGDRGWDASAGGQPCVGTPDLGSVF